MYLVRLYNDYNFSWPHWLADKMYADAYVGARFSSNPILRGVVGRMVGWLTGNPRQSCGPRIFFCLLDTEKSANILKSYLFVDRHIGSLVNKNYRKIKKKGLKIFRYWVRYKLDPNQDFWKLNFLLDPKLLSGQDPSQSGRWPSSPTSSSSHILSRTQGRDKVHLKNTLLFNAAKLISS